MIRLRTLGLFLSTYTTPPRTALKYQPPRDLRQSSSMAATATATAEASESSTAQQNYKIVQDIGNFAETEAQRPDFDHAKPIETTKSPYPTWDYGQGVPDHGASQSQEHHEVDPYAPDRPSVNNYRLLVSAIAPRPVGFLSTVNSKGQKNLSPFSYFQVIDHDPPMFIVGFSSRPGRVKDTYRNLKETGECVINTVSENMIEAVNATSIDAPYGVSEWAVSGLHEAPSTTVKPSRVKESVFSVEGKVIDIKEFADHQRPGMSIAATVLIKATRFWLRPVGQLGGVSYGRVVSTFERPGTKWSSEVVKSELLARLEEKGEN
ncbi:nitrilotriacetate monooxygenase component B [Aspergillus flavus]|uniref:Nitrilotriacetate monooxygenase component B n=1 Tax=Aspergillus flavus (strain ATCC 200026 / FGSC A1120 / IAM 13836 / NRRL 3357 / JCM 12722 / SRRC 167) TaxID=332952 RepID=A0A7U2MU67_ASPFN|nr:nitrilotriacetate monooxygenase component B [Aspergillus flavus]